MKRIAFFFSFALMSAFLFGCQQENETGEAEEVMSESAATESEGVLVEGDIAKVELSETKGMSPSTYEERAELDIFHDLFSSSIRQPGIVNMTDPEFYLKVVMEDGEKRYLHLWLGGAGEIASLMNAADTHTIYSVTPRMKEELTELLGELNK